MNNYRNSIFYKIGYKIQNYIDKAKDENDRNKRAFIVSCSPLFIGTILALVINIICKTIL